LGVSTSFTNNFYLNNLLGTTTFFELDAIAGDIKTDVGNFFFGGDKAKITEDGDIITNGDMTCNTLTATTVSSTSVATDEITLTGTTESMTITPETIVAQGLINSSTIAPSYIKTSGSVLGVDAQFQYTTFMPTCSISTTTLKSAVKCSDLGTNETEMSCFGITTANITSQATGKKNLNIDTNVYDTGGTITIGCSNATTIKMGSAYCDILFYDNGGYARLNQVPRVAAPPIRNNPFEVYSGLFN
jgi:hypothetical protein